MDCIRIVSINVFISSSNKARGIKPLSSLSEDDDEDGIDRVVMDIDECVPKQEKVDLSNQFLKKRRRMIQLSIQKLFRSGLEVQ